jgi:hypothetical protein
MMPNEEPDSECDLKKWRLQQARAMLALFEGDRGRAAATLEEVKTWAAAQDDEHLQFRVNRHLYFMFNRHSSPDLKLA